MDSPEAFLLISVDAICYSSVHPTRPLRQRQTTDSLNRRPGGATRTMAKAGGRSVFACGSRARRPKDRDVSRTDGRRTVKDQSSRSVVADARLNRRRRRTQRTYNRTRRVVKSGKIVLVSLYVGRPARQAVRSVSLATAQKHQLSALVASPRPHPPLLTPPSHLAILSFIFFLPFDNKGRPINPSPPPLPI